MNSLGIASSSELHLYGWLPPPHVQREVLARCFGKTFVEGQSVDFIEGAYAALVAVLGDGLPDDAICAATPARIH